VTCTLDTVYPVLQDPLPLPVIAYGGQQDQSVEVKDLNDWNLQSSEADSNATVLFDGGHFYVESHRVELLADITTRLQVLLDSLPRSLLQGQGSAGSEKLQIEMFEDQVRLIPESVALECPASGRKWTFQELEEEATLLAGYLQGRGLCSGKVVATYFQHSAEYVVAKLAIFKAGGAIFPLETNYTEFMLTECCEQADVVLVMTSVALQPKLPEAYRSSAFLMEQGWKEVVVVEHSSFVHVAYSPEDLGYMSMTSGTTGKPKCIMVSQRAATYCWETRYQLYPYLPGEREGYNVFFVWECLRSICMGHTAVIIPDSIIFDPPSLGKFISANKIHRILTTPSLLENIFEHPGMDLGCFDKMHMWLLMGEVVPSRLISNSKKKLHKLRLVNAYSSWESLDTSYDELDNASIDTRLQKSAAVGHANPGIEIAITDPNGELTPYGVSGEIYLGGNSLAMGYLNDQEKTVARFGSYPSKSHREILRSERWYRTGDKGVLIPGGKLLVQGRMGSEIKIRGFKVGLAMVEHAVQETEGVAFTCVVPVIDAASGQPECLAAYVVGSNGKPNAKTMNRVKKETKAKVPEYAYPKYFVPLEAMPLKDGESRKLDQAKLPAPLPEHDAAFHPNQDKNNDDDVEEDSKKMQSVLTHVFKKVLGLSEVSISDNFFELGGHSLTAAKLIGELAETYGITVTITDLYANPSVAELASFLVPQTGEKQKQSGMPIEVEPRLGLDKKIDIAFIGVAGKFPGADNVDAFWSNLCKGHDSVKYLDKEFLESKGVPSSVYEHPDWVPAVQLVDDADKFDAAFFGLSRAEATAMDPQHRLFMEVAHEALENAGYAPRSGTSRHGAVFAATGIDGYLIHHLEGEPLKDGLDPLAVFLGELGNEKDYIATRVSYALDLGGPSMTVQSACSSGLVAATQAASALVLGQADIAIAGASALTFPSFGFLHAEGMVNTQDGLVRPFDESASGTLFGDAVGAVVMKPLELAERDGDNIWGVLQGYSVTNDGRRGKAGYAAPSSQGQRNAIVGAQKMAKWASETVSFVECHATATNIGDGIEVNGLKDAFSMMHSGEGQVTKHCALGSHKGNIGHANCAAGMVGLIKALLCLKNKTLVPTAHFEDLTEKIELENTPFFIHEGCTPWHHDPVMPRRLGVSSFGIGGTNAHMCIEEYKPKPKTISQENRAGSKQKTLGFSPGRWETLVVSARSLWSLEQNARKLAGYLEQESNWEVPLSDVAHTLLNGREAHEYRLSVNAVTHRLAAVALADVAERVKEAEKWKQAAKTPSVVFLFPGQGSQYLNMGRGLYQSSPLYREHMDECVSILETQIGYNLLDYMFADLTPEAESAFNKDPTKMQPGLFCTEYAMAKTLMAIGIQPAAVAGHSIGEYVAATISGVMELEDALSLISLRAKVCLSAPEGGMLSVLMGQAEVESFIAETNEASSSGPCLWLAAANSPTNIVVSGTNEAIADAMETLKARNPPVKCAKVHVNRGFHSPLMHSAATAVAEFCKGMKLGVPKIPMTSNVTGKWLKEEASEADYWAQHMEGAVRFSDNARTFLQWEPTVVLEVGPGQVLSTLTSRCNEAGKAPVVSMQTMRHPKAVDTADMDAFTRVLGMLWEAGIKYESKLLLPDSVRRVELPTYAFQRKSFWVNPLASSYVNPSPEEDEPDTEATTHDSATCMEEELEEEEEEEELVEVPCIVRYKKKRGQDLLKLRLYCAPFAGGSSQVFSTWASLAPYWLDVACLELPGRAGRIDEPRPHDEMSDKDELAALTDAIIADSNGLPVVLCGFSMGALVCTELNKRLRDKGIRVLHQFIAGRSPPLVGGSADTGADVSTYVMASPEVQASEAWENHFKPMLLDDLAADQRAEIRLAEASAASRNKGGSLLHCPLDVMAGSDDTAFPWEVACEWASLFGHAQETLPRHYFPGGHDFMTRCNGEIFTRILATLGPHVTAKTPAAAAAESPLHAVKWVPKPVTAAVEVSKPTQYRLSLGVSELEESVILEAAEAMEKGDIVTISLEFHRDERERETSQGWAFLHLIQSLAGLEAAGRIILVAPASTHGSLSVGASKVVPMEHPEFPLQRVFLPNKLFEATSELSSEVIESAIEAAISSPLETDIWLKGKGKRFKPLVPRLELISISNEDLARTDPLDIEEDGKILITGGTGGIGSALIDWLIDVRGVQPASLIICSRRPGLHPRGCTMIQADVSDPDSLLSSEALRSLENVAGVFHLAGVLDDGLISNMTPERVQKVAAPKVAALHLLDFIKQEEWSPAWFVVYSSTSSLFGYPGQANYCAANALLDGLATWGLEGAGEQDFPILTMNWGPWGEAGMAAKGTKAYDLSIENGEYPMGNMESLEALHTAMVSLQIPNSNTRQFTVCRCDWAKTHWHGLPLVSAVEAQVKAANSSVCIQPIPQDKSSVKPTKKKSSGKKGGAQEGSVVRGFLENAVGHWAPDESLAALGLDSLDTVSIRNSFIKEFGVNVKLSLFASPSQTLGELMKKLDKELSAAAATK